MPPKSKSITPTTSHDLVPVGQRHVATKNKNSSKRNENGEKPTTARAMILRNGRYGARGTGELMLVTKLSGREKLDLLAEDLIKQSTKAIMSPFRLEQCLKIAESQRNAFLDDITNLRDPQLFFHIIQAELNARTRKETNKSDLFENPSYVASVVATRIHNAYMLASAWKLVSNILFELAELGLTDGAIKLQLKSNPDLRARYLTLYDLVNVIVDISQAKFSVLATTTPHYARYFKSVEGSDTGEPDIIFDWAELREACVSFLDSIVIELCFPRAPYPKVILYQILRDAVEESPKEAKRFPQALWDAVGDLSVSVELQQLLEAPLVGYDGQYWKDAPHEMPKEYNMWVDAQIHSEKAAGEFANYENIIFPLEKTRAKGVLDNMWKYVNLNYKKVSGNDIDTLWGVNEALEATPQWHSFYLPNITEDADSDTECKPPLVTSKGGMNRSHSSMDIANDSDDSLPELKSVSNSSDETDGEDDESSEDDDFDNSDSGESGYDTDQEDELREMLREAMDTAHEADWLHSTSSEGNITTFSQEDRKGNPFLKLLGSLRGRMFSSNPKLRSVSRKEPLESRLSRDSEYSSELTTTQVAAQPIPAGSKTHKPTIENVEKEGEAPLSPKKKKKKPKKKKLVSPETGQAPVPEIPKSSIVQTIPSQPVKVSTPSTSITLPTTPPKKSSTKLAHKPASIGSAPTHGSTVSLPLPLPVETVAQSARSYVRGENLDAQKVKVKSRPNHATAFIEKPGKKGILPKILGRGKANEEPGKGTISWFTKLGKKSKGYMHQLLRTADDDTKGTAPMKWEHFLRVMREMGFIFDPSTAGSSVRFDPPDKRDKVSPEDIYAISLADRSPKPITFHKPHPDPTLQPLTLKAFAKRLKHHYGWNEQDFMKHVGS